MSGHGLAIAGGRLRGVRLRVPAGIRPTGGRVREALFDLWAAEVPGARFLELFAGSGAVGFEALSRGAARVVLVEAASAAHAVLQGNLRRVGGGPVALVRARLPEELADRLPAGELFDLVFADPPYGFQRFEELLIAVEPWLSAAGGIALEHRWRDGAPVACEALAMVDSRRYGDSGLTLYRRRQMARQGAGA